MDDTISRKAAIDAIEEYADRLQMVDWKENPGVPYKAYALNWCINTIRDLPPAQPERKTGRWIDAVLPNDNGGLPVQVCDQCNTFFPLAYTGGGHRFCPNCGAEMLKGEDDAEVH